MRALAYLILTQAKNRILYLRKKPGMLILYIFIFLILLASVIFMFISTNNYGILNADRRIIYLFISGFGLLYLYTYTFTGLSTGSSFFTMADVSLLFVAPISPIKILVYGLISAVGKAMIASIFILYQIPNLKNFFGYGFKEIIALFFIYSVLAIFSQLLSIGVYVFTNGNQYRKKMVRSFLGVLTVIIAGSIFLFIKNEQAGMPEVLYRYVDSKWFGYMPVAGWATMFFKGVLTGSVSDIVISLGMFLILSIIFVLLLAGHEADYYEDVLYSTEVMHQKLIDAKEGRNVTTNVSRQIKIKEKEHGINKGKGANVIIHKHLLEMKRSNGFIFVDAYTILVTIGIGIAGYFIKTEIFYYTILTTLIYLQYFWTVFGRLKLELVKPYIYMIPEPSYKKLFAASISSLLKPCTDSVIFFGILAIVGRANVLLCIFMALAYIASGAVFVGLTIVYQRVLGGQPNMFARVFIGMILMLLVIAPGVIASVLFAIHVLPESLQFMATLPYTIICLILAAIMFFACRNLIDKAEYSDKLI